MPVNTLQYTDEEVLQNYEEFFEDVHGEFLKHGEIVNFKVCRNESSHLRGNVYVQFQSVDSALTAYSALNGRFYASKQITCEFVVVTRWRAALCGEYMRSHHKVCSHGTACNFLHCFKNPCGLYDWADWDNPPPRSFSATGRRSRGDLKEDKDNNHKYHGRSHRRHIDTFSSKSRRSHQCDDNRASRERRYEGHRSNDSSCEESLLVDRDHLQKERQHRSSKKRYKGRHSSKGSSEESLSVERDGLREERRRRSSGKRIREEDCRTKRKEDARKQRHRSRSQDRPERKRHGVFHDWSRTRGDVDKKSAVRREHRRRSCESSQSDGGTPCEVRQEMREKRCDSHERYRPRSRSLSSGSLEQSPEDKVVLRRSSSSGRRKRRNS